MHPQHDRSDDNYVIVRRDYYDNLKRSIDYYDHTDYDYEPYIDVVNAAAQLVEHVEHHYPPSDI